MPKLILPSPQNSEQFTPKSPDQIAGKIASAADIGNTQRGAGASAIAQGAGIGGVLTEASMDIANQQQRYFEQAQASFNDYSYNNAYSKAQLDYMKAVQDRMSKPTDANGNPNYATLPQDINKIGQEISDKYSANITNPDVNQRFRESMNQLITSQSVTALNQSREQQQQYAVGSLVDNINSSTNFALQDNTNRDMYFTQASSAIDSALNSGYISPEAAVKQKEALRHNVYYGSLELLKGQDPEQLDQILKSSTPEDLKINQMEYGQLVKSNQAALKELNDRRASVQKEQEKLQLQQYNFNNQNAEVELAKGSLGVSGVQTLYDQGKINHDQWSKLTIKAMEAQGINAKKAATLTNITGDISANKPLVGYSQSDINDHYKQAVQLATPQGQQLNLMQKAQIASQYKTTVTSFTDEVKAEVMGNKDPNKVLEAVRAMDYLASTNPSAIQGVDKETLALTSLIATQSKATNQDPARIIDNARAAIVNIDPTVREFRNTQFSSQDKFKPGQIEETVNSTIQSTTAGIIGSNKVQKDLLPMYNSLLKEAYNLTGDQDAAIAMVKTWTANTVGTSDVNSIERLGRDKQQAMLYPPEKLLPQYSSQEIRTNLNQSLSGILTDNSHNSPGLVPDQVFIKSDQTTRQDLSNPSYLLYYLDKDGNEQVLLDKNGIPVHYKIDQTERAKMDQLKIDELRVQHEKALEGNDAQKELQNRTLDKIFRGSLSSTSVYDMAQKYVGLGEIKDRSVLMNTFNKMLGQSVDPARTPWCAAFVNTMLQANGIKGSGSLAASSFLSWGKPTMSPTQGDVVVTYPLTNGATGHVGLFAGYEYKNGQRYVKILAGNANNNVAYQSFPEGVVRGYRQPPSASELQTDDKMKAIMGATMSQQPRGLRNNNPGNLRLTDQTWQGEVKGQDSAFKTFSTPEDGIRGIETSLNKKAARGLSTVQQIISSYAPPSENNTTEYVNQVAKKLGVNPNQKLDLNDQETKVKLISAIIDHENGENPFGLDGVRKALAQNSVPNIRANNPKVPIRELSPKEIRVLMKENKSDQGNKQ